MFIVTQSKHILKILKAHLRNYLYLELPCWITVVFFWQLFSFRQFMEQ